MRYNYAIGEMDRRPPMDVMEATQTAKRYIVELFTGEQIANVGLEEVEFDDTRDEWSVTIGFSRPWDNHSPNILSRIHWSTWQREDCLSVHTKSFASVTKAVRSSHSRIAS